MKAIISLIAVTAFRPWEKGYTTGCERLTQKAPRFPRRLTLTWFTWRRFSPIGTGNLLSSRDNIRRRQGYISPCAFLSVRCLINQWSVARLVANDSNCCPGWKPIRHPAQCGGGTLTGPIHRPPASIEPSRGLPTDKCCLKMTQTWRSTKWEVCFSVARLYLVMVTLLVAGASERIYTPCALLCCGGPRHGAALMSGCHL